MAFSINIVTSAGAGLIAQATSSNPIVFVDCYCGDTAAQDAQDLATKDLNFYNFGGGSSQGTIFAASATDNVARIVMNFNSSDCDLQEPEYIRSACIRGKLQSQTDADAVIMAALSDAQSEIQIPSRTAPEINIHIPINITINADDQVATVGAQYASLADLARFVSMYKAGNPSQGDNQSVKGNKEFENDVTFWAGLYADDNAVFGNGLTSSNDIVLNGGLDYGENNYESRVNTNNLECIKHNNSLILGSILDSTHYLTSLKIQQTNTGGWSGITQSACIDNANKDAVVSSDVLYEDDDAWISHTVYRCSNYEKDTDNATSYYQDGKHFEFSIKYDGGSNKVIIYDYYDDEGDFCLRPQTGDTLCLGADSCRWDKGYFNTLDFHSGILPHPSKQTGSTGITTPIGSIVMLYVYNLDMAYSETAIGSTITSAANHACYTAPYSSTTKQMYVNGLVFVALQSIDWVVSGSYHEAAFLAMRVG